MPIILQKIADYLPKTNLVVNLFNADDREDTNGIGEIKVKIRLSFKESKANEELKVAVGNIHSGKISEALQNREKLVKRREERSMRRFGSMAANRSVRNDQNRLSTQSMQRPISAQTNFSASFHHTLRNMVKENNAYRQTHGVRTLTSATGRTMRPQTAATYKSFNAKTFDARTVKSSYSVATLPTPGKKKKRKGVKVTDIEFTSEVNEENQVVFENIPKAVYSIETTETPFFQKGSRNVDLFEENDAGGS